MDISRESMRLSVEMADAGWDWSTEKAQMSKKSEHLFFFKPCICHCNSETYRHSDEKVLLAMANLAVFAGASLRFLFSLVCLRLSGYLLLSSSNFNDKTFFGRVCRCPRNQPIECFAACL